MSKIKNGGLDQYDAEPFEQQQFGTAGIEGVNLQLDIVCSKLTRKTHELWWHGLPPSVRGRVWKLAIGNDLNVTSGSCL